MPILRCLATLLVLASPVAGEAFFPSCMNNGNPIDVDAWLANRPISEFDATGSIGPFDRFFLSRDYLWQWPNCTTSPHPPSYTPPYPVLATDICPLSLTPFSGGRNSTSRQAADHPYATPIDCIGDERRHTGAHLNWHPDEFPDGLDLWTVEIQAPTSGEVTIRGDACSIIQATGNNDFPKGLLAKSNVDITFASNDRLLPSQTSPDRDGKWAFHMSIESQHTDVICVRLDGSWVWEDRNLTGTDASSDPEVMDLEDDFLQILVEDGDCVKAGDVIAVLPVKRNATRTPHVHFSLNTDDGFVEQPLTNWYCPNLFNQGTVDRARPLLRTPLAMDEEGVPCFTGGVASWDELVDAPYPDNETTPAFCFDYDDNARSKFESNRMISDNLLPNNQ